MLHSLYGVALGAAFLIIAGLFDAGARGMAFDADGIIETIATQPLLWLPAWQETLGHSLPVVLKTPLIELVDRSGVGVWEGTP